MTSSVASTPEIGAETTLDEVRRPEVHRRRRPTLTAYDITTSRSADVVLRGLQQMPCRAHHGSVSLRRHVLGRVVHRVLRVENRIELAGQILPIGLNRADHCRCGAMVAVSGSCSEPHAAQRVACRDGGQDSSRARGFAFCDCGPRSSGLRQKHLMAGIFDPLPSLDQPTGRLPHQRGLPFDGCCRAAMSRNPGGGSMSHRPSVRTSPTKGSELAMRLTNSGVE